jgi:aryl-alcohol dehydrogenase-like predicted oxidoreductase
MERRRLGRTGHESTIAILGGAAFARCTPAEAEEAFAEAIARGVNHLDIAPSYGVAERNLGPLVPTVRDRLFVACKTHRRSVDGARAQLEASLELLGLDHFDLYQLHGVTSLEVLDERGGAAEAILAARDEGLTRFVGVTGHDLGAPAAHLEALRRYDLDTVMFPVYPTVWADPVYRADAEALLGECTARDAGVMAIKAVARRPWGDQAPFADSWYEPWAEPATVARGVGFALSTPGVHAFCTPGDLTVLRLALDAATSFTTLDTAGRDAAMAATASDEVIFPLATKARSN